MTTELTLSAQVSRNAINVATARLPDKTVTLRFKHSEWIIIAGDIAKADLSINAYFRLLALEAPVPRQTRRRGGGAQAKIYAKFLGEINKIGSNINQLTRQANTAVKLGDAALMPHDDAFLEALFVVGEMADELRRTLKEHAAGVHHRVEEDSAMEDADDH